MTVLEGLDRFKSFVSNVESLQDEHGLAVSFTSRESPSVNMILNALGHFGDIVRYSNIRRTKGTTLSIESEDDVQDAIYFMLKPWIRDLVYEAPSTKEGGRYVIKDFKSRSLRTAIEAKYIRNQSHANSITVEIHDDIEMYSRSPEIDYIVFFIYDPNSLIADPDNLRRHLEVDRIINARAISVKVLVRP